MGKSIDKPELTHGIVCTEARTKPGAMTKHEVHARGGMDRCGYPVTRPERKTNEPDGSCDPTHPRMRLTATSAERINA